MIAHTLIVVDQHWTSIFKTQDDRQSFVPKTDKKFVIEKMSGDQKCF